MIFLLFLLSCASPKNLSNAVHNRAVNLRLTGEQAVPDFAQLGRFSVVSRRGVWSGMKSCRLKYRIYETSREEPVLVVLSHGFTRRGKNMSQWAAHFASWGFTVVTPDLCHLRPSDVNPVLAAQEIVGLAQSFGHKRVIYGGQSNGGAISLIAAATDPQAIAVLGLDTVEAYTNPTAAYIKDLAVPVFGLLGEPAGCNAKGNGLKLYKSIPSATYYHVQQSDHCDFENPSGLLCYLFCSLPHQSIGRPEIRQNIQSLSTAALLMVAYQDKAASRWWRQED